MLCSEGENLADWEKLAEIRRSRLAEEIWDAAQVKSSARS